MRKRERLRTAGNRVRCRMMYEWLSDIGVIAGAVAAGVTIFAGGWKGIGWVSRQFAASKQRRARERHLDSLGEIERIAYVYADQGGSPHEIAAVLGVRLSSVRRVLPDDYLRQFTRSGRRKRNNGGQVSPGARHE